MSIRQAKTARWFGIESDPLVLWIETFEESEDGLVLEHSHFMMEQDDLASRDFSKVQYDWDCC